jgi:pimeloyl-ACP methyl ester carboxylesterase
MTAEASRTANRTFVLLPGAGGASAWYWQRVAPLLDAAGHDAISVDLSAEHAASGLPGYARAVTDAIAGREGTVLVATSLGAFTAPLVAEQVPLAALVFVNAMIPVPGETAAAWWDNTGQPGARIEAAERGGYPSEFDVATYFFHDVPASVAAVPEEDQHDEPDAVFEASCEFTAWPQVPIRVVAGAGDRVFPAAFQQRVARERLGVEADVLPGGHLMALSQPEPLARYLLAVCLLGRPPGDGEGPAAFEGGRLGHHLVTRVFHQDLA